MSEQNAFAEFPELGNQGLLFGKQTRCIECGRPLSAEASQERGMGPVCAKKARDDAHALIELSRVQPEERHDATR